MDPPPALNGDSGLAGWKVTEQLQTLSVACVAVSSQDGPSSAETGSPGLELKEGEKGTLLPPEGRLAEAPPGLHEETESALAGPHGGGVEEGAPHHGSCLLESPAVSSSCGGTAAEKEPPPLGNGSSSSLSSSSCGSYPSAGGEPGSEAPTGGECMQPRSGAGVEEKRLLPSPGFSSSDSCLVGFNGDPKHSGLAGSEGEGRRPASSLAVLGGEKDSSVMEGSDDGSSSSNSSESESDTETDSSSSVSSSSSCLPMLSEDEDKQSKNEDNSLPIRKKRESCTQEQLPVEEFTIILPESVELMPFGKVSGIIENLVIIESQKGLPPVNEETVLFKEDHHSVGKVFEVFGPVSHPFYVLQFNSPEHIESKGIKMHDAVYFAPSVESFTQYIFPEKLKQDRGSDASWKNDDEPPAEALDYSDDEKERAAKQQKKSQNLRRKKCRSQQDDSNENGVHYQPRRQNPSDYSSRYCTTDPNSGFARRRFPHSSASVRSFRQYENRPLHYSGYTGQRKPSGFCQQQRQENLGRHQYSFPPPSFETVSNQVKFPPPPPSVTWGWPHGCSQNVYDPLWSLLSLPPPPPPPVPPPSSAHNNANP